MSWLDFISRMTGSLAWPVAAIVGTAILRRPIATLLTSGPLRRVKAGPFEVEIDRSLAETETTLEAIGVSPPPVTDSSIRQELAIEVIRAPAVAILEAHQAVERELRNLLTGTGVDGLESAGAVRLARMAAQRGIISEESARSVETISVLRNLVAHSHAREVTNEQAQEYLAYADAVLFAIEQDRLIDHSKRRHVPRP